MDAGKLDRRVRLQRDAGGQSGTGEPQRNWVDVGGLVAAGKEAQTGKEQLRGGAETVRDRASFIVRYREDIQAGWRLIDQGDKAIWDIEATAEVGRRAWLTMTCTRWRG